MATYLLTGGTGLIGQSICHKLVDRGHDVIVLTRDNLKASRLFKDKVVAVEQLHDIPNDQTIDIVINLAGAPIADRRWTAKRKTILHNSRVALTKQLVSWLGQRTNLPQALISGSAVGWYGDQQSERLTERSNFKDDFAHRLCEDWEQAALKAKTLGIRVAIVRTGLVLAKQGGFLSKLLLPFKMGLGGPIADGRQYMPWVHINDIRDLFLFLADNKEAHGVYNGTAPKPVTNSEFTHSLASELKRPAVFRVPSVFLRAVLGEMADLLLGGQQAIPEKVHAAGFRFEYTELRAALKDVLA
ncbi:TIGR01777 family oxidoreductase [Methylophaga sp. OBS3]|uniref:TIGR01777 family oxidoreductase n=1 Tax=Methylophaga sp. OBS3 TaxID=2991934 RepID=UPI002259E0C7|nr:TIGR01777 family oxidoreductase [Methylophaga sp. OBS3]MCX4190593.1 TIGR01777 family oxidoreductase [Methylophaga sp. OBS3]